MVATRGTSQLPQPDSPKSRITKRQAHEAAAASSSLVGRKVSVPYSLIISDDYSGCFCDATVLEVSKRGCLVVLAGEHVWRPEAFIRRWLVDSDRPSDAQLRVLFDDLSTSTVDGGGAGANCTISPVP